MNREDVEKLQNKLREALQEYHNRIIALEKKEAEIEMNWNKMLCTKCGKEFETSDAWAEHMAKCKR